MTQQRADRLFTAEAISIALLIFVHTVICCVSLAYVAQFSAVYHIFYEASRLPSAVISVAAFALVSITFCFASFSFGYVVGFFFYTMISGYLWLNCFTDLDYDHFLSGLSAAVSAIAFLLPALFIVAPIDQVHKMS